MLGLGAVGQLVDQGGGAEALDLIFDPFPGVAPTVTTNPTGSTSQTIILVTVSLRYYPIPYQWGRVALLFIAAGGVYAACSFLPPASELMTVVFKLGLLASFPILLWLLRFFESTELDYAQQLATSLLRRVSPSRS